MLKSTLHEQALNEFGGYLEITAEAFLLDKQAAGLSPNTLRIYKNNLRAFLAYCDGQAAKRIQDITPTLIRRYMLTYAENHNSGGVHQAYRVIKTFLRWIEAEEVMYPDWKNPINKVRTPKLIEAPLEPVSLADFSKLIAACKSKRDKAIFYVLLDTGLRASELCALDVTDIDIGTGAIYVRFGKAGKSRTVFVGRKTRRGLRDYLRSRRDTCPALFVTVHGERFTYSGLRLMLRRNAQKANLSGLTLHGFRRAFALNFLRSGGDIFSLQRLMGHADLQTLRRYLKLTDTDLRKAHRQYSPIDSL